MFYDYSTCFLLSIPSWFDIFPFTFLEEGKKVQLTPPIIRNPDEGERDRFTSISFTLFPVFVSFRSGRKFRERERERELERRRREKGEREKGRREKEFCCVFMNIGRVARSNTDTLSNSTFSPSPSLSLLVSIFHFLSPPLPLSIVLFLALSPLLSIQNENWLDIQIITREKSLAVQNKHYGA